MKYRVVQGDKRFNMEDPRSKKLLDRKVATAVEVWDALYDRASGGAGAAGAGAEDEPLEFRFDEAQDVTTLVNVTTGEVKAMAASKFHESIEKEERLDLKEAPKVRKYRILQRTPPPQRNNEYTTHNRTSVSVCWL